MSSMMAVESEAVETRHVNQVAVEYGWRRGWKRTPDGAPGMTVWTHPRHGTLVRVRNQRRGTNWRLIHGGLATRGFRTLTDAVLELGK